MRVPRRIKLIAMNIFIEQAQNEVLVEKLDIGGSGVKRVGSGEWGEGIAAPV